MMNSVPLPSSEEHDLASVLLDDDLKRDRQSHARSLAQPLSGEERLEYPTSAVSRDAYAIVGNADDDTLSTRFGANRNLRDIEV